MRPHGVCLHFGLLDSMSKAGPRRRRIMEFIRGLRERPETPGDYTDKDASQRERQIKIVGDHAVVYWLDVPVQIGMVVDAHPADG